MKKNKNGNNIFVYIILLLIFIFLSIVIYCVVNENKKNAISSDSESIEPNDDIIYAGFKPFEEEKTMKVIINDIEYEMKLENNNASFDLLSVLPLRLEMNDLNDNEKYSYLSFSLTNLDDYTGKISKGDIMLFQSNCIVIFYKDFETNYKYTKLGHIDNLPEFNNDSIEVLFYE